MTEKMHPARARRLQAKLPPRPHHNALLRPLGRLSDSGCLIVTYPEPSFIEALYEDLGADDWAERLLARQNWDRHKQTGLPRLSPPLHIKTNVILFELVCDQPGYPPVAPTKIDSMGFVMRRTKGSTARLQWLKHHGKPMGWQPIAVPSDGALEVDPDPERRMEIASAQVSPALEAVAQHRNRGGLPSEDTFLLNRAPPDICAKLGRTVLFATLPLATAETSPAADDFVDYNTLPQADAAKLDNHLSLLLKAGGARNFAKGGQLLSPSWKPLQDESDAELTRLGEFLRQTQNELGLTTDTPAAQALLAELNTLLLPMADSSGGPVTSWKPAGEFLLEAAPILLGEQNNASSLRMPLFWPSRSDDKGTQLLQLARDSLTERAKEFQPDTPKFNNAGWRYAIKPFARLSHGPDCPIRLVWGEESDPFHIKPWWDSDAPPQKISLPDIADLKNMKPNVAFEMPPVLANLLAQDPLKLAEGDGSKPSSIGLGWLCSFSIPIITICAFIVLNIFLQLFNIFFSWLLWIKICIPIPVPQEGE